MTGALPSTEADGLSDIDLLVEASLAAGRTALGFFRNDVEIFWKNEGTSPVTAADHAANDVLQKMLLSARPDYGWLSEESEDDPARLDATRVFIVDPIDGTRAFMSGRDTWCVSAAITENGRSIAGVLFAPALDELYVATSDGRVEKNGKPLRLAPRDRAETIRVSAADDMITRFGPFLGKDLERFARIPSLAYRIAMVADGRLDATIVKPNAHDWDIAAATLILANAGGRTSDLDGVLPEYNLAVPRHGILLAARPELVKSMLSAA